MQIKGDQKRLTLSFAASVAAHVAIVLLVAFVHVDKPLPKKQKPQVMDVVMLDPQTTPLKTPPKDAKTISNLNAEGGNNQSEDQTTRAARSPMTGRQPQQKPQLPKPQMPKTPPPTSKDQRVRTLARRGMELENEPETSKMPMKKPKPTERWMQTPLSNVLPSSMALSQFSTDIQREKQLKERLNKEDTISISTRNEKYAAYMEMLVRALEEQWRPGDADYGKYPDDKRRALLEITIESNGSLSDVKMIQPSPITEINESAIAAIHAASFRPLPSAWGLDRIHIPISFEVVEERGVFHTM